MLCCGRPPDAHAQPRASRRRGGGSSSQRCLQLPPQVFPCRWPQGNCTLITACRREAESSFSSSPAGPCRLEGPPLANRLAASRNHKRSRLATLAWPRLARVRIRIARALPGVCVARAHQICLTPTVPAARNFKVCGRTRRIYIYIYIYIYTFICVSLSLYIYIHTHTHVYTYVYIYIYILATETGKAGRPEAMRCNTMCYTML